MDTRRAKEINPSELIRSRTRLLALHSYGILDTPPEAAFDELVQLVARLCSTPIAAISLLDDQRQWFKAAVGLPVKQTDVSASFCRYALAQHEVFEVPDAQEHAALKHSVLVTGDLGLRFYAGYPLVTPHGEVLGTLMVADRVPRRLTDDQHDSLKVLAKQVMVALDLHRQRARLRQELRQQAHYHAAIHELAERSGPVAYWGRPLDVETVFVAPETATMLGLRSQDAWSEEELLMAIDEADRDRWRQALIRCVEEGVSMDVECRWLRGGELLATRWLALRSEANDREDSKLIGAVIDVTARRSVDDAEQRVRERFQFVAELTSDALWEWDLPTHTIWWSAAMQRLFGYPAVDKFPAENTRALVHADDLPAVEQSLRDAIACNQATWSRIFRLMRADGTFAHVESRARIVRNDAGVVLRVVGAVTDISDPVRWREERDADMDRLKQQAMLLDQARDAIVVKDLHHRIQFWNTGAELLYGWTRDEVLGRHEPTVLQEDPELVRQLEQNLRTSGEFQRDVVHYHKDGHRIDTRVHWTLVKDETGKPHSIFAIASDITQSRRDRDRIQNLAFYDQLTRLPNRTLLTDRLNHAIASSVRHRQCGALMFLDLDNFKSLNDTLGHAKGDELLQQAAKRLRSCVRAVDTVARLGGDEFVMLLEELGQDADHAAWQAEAVAIKVLEQLRQPFMLGDHAHLCTASIGVTLFGKLGRSIDELLKQADIAMYEAKAAGRNTVRFFDPEMQQLVLERAHIENDLRRASLHDEFVLHYQPQWSRDGKLSGMEALLRWQHPRRGLLEPGVFLTVAEDSGLILPLGRWVLQQACRQLADWHRAGKMMRMAVNISASQLRSDEFVADVRSALTDSSAPPGYLSLELTESMLMKDLEAAVRTMWRIKEMGVRFALDDFGTGFSSLSVLERLPIDDLKIDRSFVHRLGQGRRNNQMVQSIVALGKTLDLNIIAEGIETEGQHSLLQEFGCDEFQGFLRGPSMSLADATRTLFAN